jgi:hypothetical protein
MANVSIWSWYLLILGSKYSKWYIRFDRLNEPIAMVQYNYLFEILLFDEKLQNPTKHMRTPKLVELVIIKTYNYALKFILYRFMQKLMVIFGT